MEGKSIMSEEHVWVRRDRLYLQTGGYSEGCFCGGHALVALNRLITENNLTYVHAEHGYGFEPLVEIAVTHLDRRD